MKNTVCKLLHVSFLVWQAGTYPNSTVAWRTRWSLLRVCQSWPGESKPASVAVLFLFKSVKSLLLLLWPLLLATWSVIFCTSFLYVTFCHVTPCKGFALELQRATKVLRNFNEKEKKRKCRFQIPWIPHLPSTPSVRILLSHLQTPWIFQDWLRLHTTLKWISQLYLTHAQGWFNLLHCAERWKILRWNR